MMINTIDYIRSIVNKEKITDLTNYSQFVMNAYFSKFRNCLFIIEYVNEIPNITNKMHYDFLFNMIPFGWQRKVEYSKTELSDIEKLVIDYYKINSKHVKDYMNLLSVEELQSIKDYYAIGGRIGNKKHA